MLTFPHWVYAAVILCNCHFVIFFFPTATDLILTDQFSLLSVTANMSVILPVKSLATPKGTRCTYSSFGVTRPSSISNSRAVKTYRLVYNQWGIWAWIAFPNKGRLAPAVWFPELELRNTERIGQFTVRVVQNMLKRPRSRAGPWRAVRKLKLRGSRINGHTDDIRKDYE